ncbi:MAG: hypothetical protein Q9209_002811 [Squamulea sp. 1 TL-2023]
MSSNEQMNAQELVKEVSSEEKRGGQPKSYYFTPDGQERYPGAWFIWDMQAGPKESHQSRNMVAIWRADYGNSRDLDLPERPSQWFHTRIMRKEVPPIKGKALLDLQENLLERDKKIRGDFYSAEMTHYDILSIEAERKRRGSKPHAFGKLLNDDEIWELENCQRQRGLGRFGGEWRKLYGKWVVPDPRLKGFDCVQA